jgi:hypothetical protein
MKTTSEPLFRETQQFRQRWLWWLLLPSNLLVIAIFGYGLYQQLILGQPWGERPLSDIALIIVSLLSIGLSLAVSYLFQQMKLITEVRSDGLYLRFFPLRARLIDFSNISHCAQRIYQPIKEYGGWGIRYSRQGKAYNISGNDGVQLEFQQGKPLLIGSQRAGELEQAIRQRLKV